jgi:hypothetical protein
MNYHLQKWLLFLSICTYAPLCGISIVYNFRIAQITKQPITEAENMHDYSTIGLIFDQYNKTRDDRFQNFVGGLGAFIYNFQQYYFRTDFAVSHVNAHTDNTLTFSGTVTDDLLFTIGRNFILGDCKVITLSGLFGVPTHEILSLQHAQLGYGQVGTGLQLDGAYPIRHNSSLLYGVRYVHFFVRDAKDDCHNTYRFGIGNLEDFLLSYKTTWTPHGLEVGYTSRFQFGASICPNLDTIVERTNYIRSNFYAVYKYKFNIRDIANRLLFNISYGYDHTPHQYGNQYIVTLWGSWNVNF